LTSSPLAIVAALAFPLAGCPNTDPAVFIDPTISSPSLTVGMPSVLVTGITSGGFTLDLHLGARAAGPDTVKLGEFSLLNGSMSDTFVPSLQVNAGSGYTNGSAVVDQNSDLVTAFTLSTQELSSSTSSAICGAGGVVFEGSIDDSLKGTTVPVYSDIFQPSGCP